MTHPAIVHEAKEFAGVFYDQDRSALFRSMWPSQDEYVQHKWVHFVAPVIKIWSEMLGRPDVPERMKDFMFKAIVANAAQASSPNALDVIQLAPDTQQFRGDPFENRETAKKIGNGGDNHRHLMTTAVKFRL